MKEVDSNEEVSCFDSGIGHVSVPGRLRRARRPTTPRPIDDQTEQPAEEPTEGAYKVAMITDYGDITDQSFNQTTYEACKAFCRGQQH